MRYFKFNANLGHRSCKNCKQKGSLLPRRVVSTYTLALRGCTQCKLAKSSGKSHTRAVLPFRPTMAGSIPDAGGRPPCGARRGARPHHACMCHGPWFLELTGVSTACLGARPDRRAPNPFSARGLVHLHSPSRTANLQFVTLGPRPSAREGTGPKFVDATTPPHLKIRPSSSTSTKAGTHGAAGCPPGP